MRHRTILSLAVFLLLPGAARAGGSSFTEYVIADFELQELADTPINPGPASPFISFQAVGDLTFTLDPSINDPTKTTVPITGVTGTLTGDSIPPGFPPFTISPDLQFLGGDLTNILRDGSGKVLSADVSDLSMRWEMVLETPTPVTLYTQDGLPFDGPITSIPFAIGTVLSGPADFYGYLQGGGSDPVLLGRDRTLTIAPEPGSGVLAGLAAVALGAVMAGRRRRRPAGAGIGVRPETGK